MRVGGTPRWSPDGEEIAFDAPLDGEFEVYAISSLGGPTRRVTTSPSADTVPSYSHDGRWIYFASDRSGEWQVWKVPVEGEGKQPGSAQQMTRQGGFAAFESPDGRFVYYAKDQLRDITGPNALWRIPVEGGKEEAVIDRLTQLSSRRRSVINLVDPEGSCRGDLLDGSNQPQDLPRRSHPRPARRSRPGVRRLRRRALDAIRRARRRRVGPDARGEFPVNSRTIRFDAFEADLTAHELSKRGVRLKLQDQPFQVLAALLENPGEVVTREELQQRIWGDGTFVDFDKSLSAAVNKVRQALDDSRTRPRFIETVPKVGYRFIGAVDGAPPAPPPPEIGGRSWRRWVLPAGLAAAAMLAWSLNPRPEPLEPSEPLRAVPLTTYQGYEDYPTFSPDGSQVAFSWDKHDGEGPAIYVKAVGSEQARRIAGTEGGAENASWSPNGESIAFIMRDGRRCELRLISPAGGASRLVTSLACPLGTVYYPSLAWSPDGRVLAYSDKPSVDQPIAVFAIDVATRMQWRLTDPPVGTFGDDGPHFSFSGRRLAFIRRLSAFNATEIRTVELDQGKKPAAASTPLRLSGPQTFRRANSVVWSRDDSELLFLQSRALWRAPADGGAASRVLSVGGLLKAASLNSQKKRLAFVQQRPDADIWSFDQETGEVQPLITSTQVDWFQSISPDGKRIAWTSWRSGFSEIWVCDWDGSNPLQLTHLETQSGSPSWSPDGKLIAFDTRVNGNGDIYVVDAGGGPVRALLDSPEDDLQPEWSPDGGRIYFTSRRAGRVSIWSVQVESRGTEAATPAVEIGEIRPIVAKAGAGPAKASPDGRFLYDRGDFYDSMERKQLYRRSLSDGKEIFIGEAPWGIAAAGDGVYFVSQDQRSILHWSADSASVEEVLKLEKETATLAVSPDERTILFTQSEPRQADLMLVEGFR